MRENYQCWCPSSTGLNDPPWISIGGDILQHLQNLVCYEQALAPDTGRPRLQPRHHKPFSTRITLLFNNQNNSCVIVGTCCLTYMPPSSWGPVFSYIFMRREQLYTNIPSRSLCSMFTPNIKFKSFGSFNALKQRKPFGRL